MCLFSFLLATQLRRLTELRIVFHASPPEDSSGRLLDKQHTPTKYRENEMVWVTLHQPIGNSSSTHHWPGICTQLEERTEEVVREVIELSDDDDDDTKVNMTIHPSSTLETITYCHVRLLGLSDVCFRHESELVPWLACPINRKRWKEIVTAKIQMPPCLIDSTLSLPTLTSLKNPVLAALFFQLALQIAAGVEQQYALGNKSSDQPLLTQRASSEIDIRELSGRGMTEIGGLCCESLKPGGSCYDTIWFGAESVQKYDLLRLTPIHFHGTDDEPLSDLLIYVSNLYVPPDQRDVILLGTIYELIAARPTATKPSDSSNRHRATLRDLAKHVIDLTGALPRHVPELPAPPKSHIFKQLTPSGKLHALDLLHLAGRYYDPTTYKHFHSTRNPKTRLGAQEFMR